MNMNMNMNMEPAEFTADTNNDQNQNHEQETLADQPIPFSTNPAWAEEIASGPTPPFRRGWNRVADRGYPSVDEVMHLPHWGMGTRTDMDTRELPYQRGDGILWQQSIKGRDSSSSNCHIPRAGGPGSLAVSDFQAPIISGPRNRDELGWIKQPLRIPKAMMGRESGNRFRSSGLVP